MSLRADLTAPSPRPVTARSRPASSPSRTVPSCPPIGLERPAKPEHGDWASNAAMQLAPVARAAPMRDRRDASSRTSSDPPSIAEVIDRRARIPQPPPRSGLGGGTGRADPRRRGASTAATPPASRAASTSSSSAPTRPGRCTSATRAARSSATSCPASSTAAGHTVEREYYFNDFGAQVVNLGPLGSRASPNGTELPEDGYRGAYVERARGRAARGGRWPQADASAGRGRDARRAHGRPSGCAPGSRRASLASACSFDVWKEEGSLHAEGWVERAVERLRAAGHVYEADGATWFRSTDFGDDKDRVIFRSNGQPTYFASRHRLRHREVQPRASTS